MAETFVHFSVSSTLGTFPRQLTFGHVHPLDARQADKAAAGMNHLALVDLNDTIVEVNGNGKRVASFGYTGLCGLRSSVRSRHRSRRHTGHNLMHQRWPSMLVPRLAARRIPRRRLRRVD